MTIKTWYSFDRINKLDRDYSYFQSLSLVYPSPPPEIPRDIAFIPSILKRLQRWWVSSINTTANFLILARLKFGMNFVVHLCGKIS